jgi:hypothetical protein
MDDFISGWHGARGIGRIWTLRDSEFRQCPGEDDLHINAYMCTGMQVIYILDYWINLKY